jgi:hypothetical protein
MSSQGYPALVLLTDKMHTPSQQLITTECGHTSTLGTASACWQRLSAVNWPQCVNLVQHSTSTTKSLCVDISAFGCNISNK